LIRTYLIKIRQTTGLFLIPKKEKKDISSNDDTTITIVTTKNMNSWKDGNTIIEIKDTTIKKKDTGKFVKLRNDKIE